jgi:hypothetical protein
MNMQARARLRGWAKGPGGGVTAADRRQCQRHLDLVPEATAAVLPQASESR